jgi:xanthine dehydrogenase small subunit
MRDEIRFVLNGKIQRVAGCAGDLTLLQWLREQAHLRGTKEGCAEGDCGACTVAMARKYGNGKLEYRPVNACILFLGMIDGAAIRTVEGLADQDGNRHPVQTAMINADASQCGFCTPGFVMSLYAAWQNGNGLAPDDIDNTLAGNLCRCTGYRSIVAAAATLDRAKNSDMGNPDMEHDGAMLAALKNMPDGAADLCFGDLCLGDQSCQFLAPATRASFAEAYAKNSAATIVSGATDIGLWVTKQHRKLGCMIWTGGVAGFGQIDDDGDMLRINPAVTHQQLLQRIADDAPEIAELLRRFGALQVRSSGTVCGNVANASPIGDLPPVLIAIGSQIELSTAHKSRSFDLENFFLEYGKQDRRVGEFVSAVIIPRGPHPYLRCYKISKRFDQDISAVMLAANMRVRDGVIDHVRLAFGGMAGIPKRAQAAEAKLVGKPLDVAYFRDAATALPDDFTPLSDMRGSAEYRMLTAQNLLMKYGLELVSGKSMRLAGDGLTAGLEGWR